MRFSLFPKTFKFYDLFLEQNEQILKAITVLEDIFTHYEDVARKSKEIQLIEAEGNTISREIARQLSQTFITPIDREDIHDINVSQEILLNVIKGISNRISLQSITQLTSASQELVKNLKLMLEEINHILHIFVKKQDPGVHVRRVHVLKEHSDMVIMQALASIYQIDLTKPDAIVDIITWSQIYDRIEKAVIRAENLANMLEGISLKYA
jgi:uncharacterized protein Yka (UPF0111/DUF47 family)